jgi:hypothetical protein
MKTFLSLQRMHQSGAWSLINGRSLGFLKLSAHKVLWTMHSGILEMRSLDCLQSKLLTTFAINSILFEVVMWFFLQVDVVI